jgi:hypothetical protein
MPAHRQKLNQHQQRPLQERNVRTPPSTPVLDRHPPESTQSYKRLHQPTLPSLLNRYRPSLPRPQPSKQPMLLSCSNLSQSRRNQLLQRKNLSFPPSLYSRLKIFTAISTINHHRHSSRIRQVNAQLNKFVTIPHMQHSRYPGSLSRPCPRFRGFEQRCNQKRTVAVRLIRIFTTAAP